ncbi:hypothetical protein SLEP1_g6552 [Rubroshorea leprosula]|uniref:Uncharacterized protein n=1 Tax=Rubroshorea leprosula TaxID=152421 RepID=A0AAV5HVK6_9ROSI|nr:hypothetical protein SLEP1_g6552 [Rubroshorea leprosula]
MLCYCSIFDNLSNLLLISSTIYGKVKIVLQLFLFILFLLLVFLFILVLVQLVVIVFSNSWAARVLVNSKEACGHGRKNVGLPSQVARFSKRITAVSKQPKGKFSSFQNMIGIGTTLQHARECVDVQVTEVTGAAAADICNIKLATEVPALKHHKWMGPAITMSLPSFSGHTGYNPQLLKYSCQIKCRVRPVEPAKVLGPFPAPKNGREQLRRRNGPETTDSNEEAFDKGRHLAISVMLSKPILALEFNCLNMRVEAPVVVPHRCKNSLRAC